MEESLTIVGNQTVKCGTRGDAGLVSMEANSWIFLEAKDLRKNVDIKLKSVAALDQFYLFLKSIQH